MPDSHLEYCDESGQRAYGPKTDEYFVVAAVLVPAQDAPHLEDEVRGLTRASWGKSDIELSPTGFGVRRSERSTTPSRMASR